MPNMLCKIDVGSQTMTVKCKSGFEKTYRISTAINGIGSESGSFKTPLGKHHVCEKIGAFAPMYAVFKSREYTGQEYSPMNIETGDDGILTRILRLMGDEDGINSGTNDEGLSVDSFNRYIYIHGTNREDLLGKPASHGCIRMANTDIAELFIKIQQGAIVDIKSAPKPPIS